MILDKSELVEKTIALESEKKANKSKSDFLSRMSYDMRTPLNGIKYNKENGGIYCSVEEKVISKENVILNFRVQNTGIGMNQRKNLPEKRQKQLYQKMGT